VRYNLLGLAVQVIQFCLVPSKIVKGFMKHEAAASKNHGTVKFFSEKGFGFITGDDGVDYFAHFIGIQKEGFKSRADGEEVEFDVETDPNTRKPRAAHITGPGGREPIGAPKKGKGKGKDGGKGKGSFGTGKFGGFGGGRGGVYVGGYCGGKDMYGVGPLYGKGYGSPVGMAPFGGMQMYGKPMGGKY